MTGETPNSSSHLPQRGVALTASGAFGVGPTSDWSRYVAAGRLPRSADGAGFGVDFATDIQLFSEIGANALRLTIDWSRIEPNKGKWDADAVDLYREIFRTAQQNNIKVWAVLHDGPLPGWFGDDERGFVNDDAVKLTWPRHVDRVAETFGDLVDAWIPFLDPFTYAQQSFLLATRPPGMSDQEKFLQVLFHLHLASFEAFRLLRSGNPKVVCCLDLCSPYPTVRTRQPGEREVAQENAELIDRLRFGIWRRALLDGVLSVPYLAEKEIDGLAGAYDVIGFTSRGAQSIFADNTSAPYPADQPIAGDGNAPWATGIANDLRLLADSFSKRPFALLGTGVVAANDEWRNEHLRETIAVTHEARDDGINIQAGFWESGIDGWTPETGLEIPNAIIDRNRNPRLSAQAMLEW